MKIRGWFGAVLISGTAACGPMPGYYVPREEAPAANAPASPPAPAPDPALSQTADEEAPRYEADDPAGSKEVDGLDDSEGRGDARTSEAPEEAPAPYVPPPKPPRYTPPRTWTPPEEPAAPEPAPRREEPPARPSEPAPGVRTIRLDEDTYYLIDSARNLCFLRHKESMTAIDCAKIPEARQATPEPTLPAKPAREAPPEPAKVKPTPPPEPARPTAPTPDEMVRFEAAFTDIFCDRKAKDDTAPEARIKARGLSVERYEAIEGWWASDENAWWTLTGRAARGCR